MRFFNDLDAIADIQDDEEQFCGWDDLEPYEIVYPPRDKACSRCGREGLHWEKRGEKWKLCDERGIHKCSIKRIQKLAKRLFNDHDKPKRDNNSS